MRIPNEVINNDVENIWHKNQLPAINHQIIFNKLTEKMIISSN